jgi:methyl-coenzyme M reductase beta subunit
MYDAPYVKSAVWGSYPVTMDMAGGNIISVLSIPQNNEGLGYALRNIPANHAAMMTHRNAMQTCALSSTLNRPESSRWEWPSGRSSVPSFSPTHSRA